MDKFGVDFTEEFRLKIPLRWRPSSVDYMRSIVGNAESIDPNVCFHWKEEQALTSCEPSTKKTQTKDSSRTKVTINFKRVDVRRVLFVWFSGLDIGDKRLGYKCSDKKCINPRHAYIKALRSPFE